MTKEQVFRAALEYAQDQNPGKAVVPDHGFVEGVRWAAEQLRAENEKLRAKNEHLDQVVINNINDSARIASNFQLELEQIRAALEAIIDRYDVANMLAGDDPIIEQARNALK